MNYVGIVITIASHIAAGLYMQKRKYSKPITAFLWAAYALLVVRMLLFIQNVMISFAGFFVLHFIFFFLSTEGTVGENTFLFLTYANSFCIFIGANCITTAFFGSSVAAQLIMAATLLGVHALLYMLLLPIYKKARPFMSSGWWKLNAVLVLFMIQFLRQYAFTIVDRQSASAQLFDFAVFGVIFYATLMILFDLVKGNAEKKQKTIENKALKKVAYVDALTGVQNRAAYMRATKKQERKYKNNTAANILLVMMDIDEFKNINDTKGHVAGDDILKRVGAVLARSFDGFRCECFRLGGDEFALLVEDAAVADVEEQIRSMNTDLLASVGVRLSYGFSAVDFTRTKPFELALKAADKEMYSDKREQKVHS